MIYRFKCLFDLLCSASEIPRIQFQDDSISFAEIEIAIGIADAANGKIISN